MFTKLRFKKICLSVILGLSAAQVSYANLPVIDVSSIAQEIQMLSQLKDQLDTMKQQYGQLVSQVDLSRQNIQNITGNYKMGGILNSTEDLTNRKWSAPDWQEALKGVAGGNNERYKELLAAYQKDHAVISVDDYGKTSSASDANNYKQSVQTNQTAATMARAEYNKINDYLDQLHQIGQQIESSQNKNTKSAIDLNSRVSQQLGYIMLEVVRMQSVLVNLMAQSQFQGVYGSSEQNQFLAIPK